MSKVKDSDKLSKATASKATSSKSTSSKATSSKSTASKAAASKPKSSKTTSSKSKVSKSKTSKSNETSKSGTGVSMDIIEVEQSEIELPTQNIVQYESDYRTIMANYDPSKNKSPPVLTIYEVPLLIGKRATQLAEGARPLIAVVPGSNHIDIAEEELRQKKIPFMIKRTVGGNVEYWKIEDLEVEF
jgi:DNA-directed RNA polymerase subunit K/omega